jgi:prefoldin subunit 5
VQALDDELQEIQNSVDQLAADIQEFRDGVASGVGQISSAVGEVNDRLESTSQNLSDLDNNLAEVQNRAIDWQSRFRTISTFAAIVVTLLLIWIIYAMVIQIQNYWAELKAERIKPDGNSS